MKPTLHFDLRTGSYWLPVSHGYWLPLDTGQAKLHLRQQGLSKEEFVGSLNQVEQALFIAQTERHVHYAGELAGHRSGSFTTADGRRVLVTSSFRLQDTKPGKCDWLDQFTGQLLGDQATPFLLWLKFARQSLESGDFRPGQLLALAGPSGCGKSLLQSVITECLGGRAGKPYRYMTGQTPFNADLASAEHWTIEDEAATTDIRTRRKFGAALKEACVNRELSVHAKGRQAITLPTFRRVSLSVNDEPENLMILPPLDESILDKVMILHCRPAEVGDDRSKVWQRILRELPHWLHAVMAMEPAKPTRDCRYGVKAHHSPALLEVLNAVSPEMRLLTLLDETVLKDAIQPWRGTAEDLERQLRASPFCFAVEKLLYFSSAAGVYLARLASKLPDRVTCERKSGRANWTIAPGAGQ